MEYYPNPSQPVPPERDGVRTRKSIWKWVLLYVLIGAVAYGLIYYFFFAKNGGYNSQNYQTQNNSVQTADWEMYKNDKFGFEFGYPKDFGLWEANPFLGLVIIYPENKFEEVRNKTISTSDEIVFAIVTNKYIDRTGIQEVMINNRSWFLKTTNKPPDGGTENGLEYFTAMDSNNYIDVATGISNKELLLKILSTFKFTDQVDQTASWKMYTNTQYGFKFEYPSNLKVIENLSSRPDQESFFGVYNIPFSVTPSDNGSKSFYVSVAPSPVAYCDNGLLSNENVNINGTGFGFVHNSIKVKNQNWTHIKIYSTNRNNLCYAIFLKFNGSYNYDGNFVVTPDDNMIKPNYDFYSENEILDRIKNTFKFTNQSDDFTFKIFDTYVNVKAELAIKGWVPVIQINQTVIDLSFPEIGNCGSGKDAICNVDFQKGIYKHHLNLQFRYTDGKLQWIVVGSE